MLERTESCDLPTRWGNFRLTGFMEESTGKDHVALTLGDVADAPPVLARVHSECLTGDALFSQRCDCGPQLELAMRRIADAGRGVILYLRQEGRGIGLLNKIQAYRLQDEGADTVEANLKLGFGEDQRDYAAAAEMFRALGVSQVRLLTNNPRKVTALEQNGIAVTERLPHQAGETAHNRRYLATKADKLGHRFD